MDVAPCPIEGAQRKASAADRRTEPRRGEHATRVPPGPNLRGQGATIPERRAPRRIPDVDRGPRGWVPRHRGPLPRCERGNGPRSCWCRRRAGRCPRAGAGRSAGHGRHRRTVASMVKRRAELACSSLGGQAATCPGDPGHITAPQGSLPAPRPGEAHPRRPHPARRPPQPRPGRPQAPTATTPMFHRCRPDDTDVPSMLLRPHRWSARPAPLRSQAHHRLDGQPAGRLGVGTVGVRPSGGPRVHSSNRSRGRTKELRSPAPIEGNAPTLPAV